MVRVTTNRGTSTRNVKKAKKNWAGSSYRKVQNRQLAGKTLTTGRGTGTRKYVATKVSGTKTKPSIRSGRGYVSRSSATKSRRATGMRAARASGKVKRSGRGYITSSGGSATKRTTARPSMRSGRGTIKRSSSGSYKKSTAKRKPSIRSGRGYVRR
jgi:hypothetical protein|tara:strand:+ start:492 stop:959 length:468 start_codon:yes stop_codon:yes gene_type:complete